MRDLELAAAASLNHPAGLIDMVRGFYETTDAVTRRTNALAQAARDEAEEARRTVARLAAELDILATDPHATDPDQVVTRTEDRATEAPRSGPPTTSPGWSLRSPNSGAPVRN